MSGAILAFIGATYSTLPVNTAIPVISGSTVVGQTLFSTTGIWVSSPSPTFTYQWQRGVSNISGATSSSYVITSDDVNSTLRCVVTATNIKGSVSATSENTAVVTLPAIGAPFGGGYYAGQMSVNANGVPTHYLIVSPRSSGQTNTQYCTDIGYGVFGSVIDGPGNTATLVAAPYSHPAATFCNNLTTGGYSDWYLPASGELEILYYNLKPTTDSNRTSNNPSVGGSAGNVYATPQRNSYYTSSVPGITASSDFAGGSQAMLDVHWSSTGNGSSGGFGTAQSYCIAFSPGFLIPQFTGYYFLYDNVQNFNVRAVRRIPI